MRYIDANKLSEEIEKSRLNNPHTQWLVSKTHDNEHRHFEIMVMLQPTVDVVEVTKCRECQYYHQGVITRCTNPNGLKSPSDDAYCSYGKRNEEKEK